MTRSYSQTHIQYSWVRCYSQTHLNFLGITLQKNSRFLNFYFFNIFYAKKMTRGIARVSKLVEYSKTRGFFTVAANCFLFLLFFTYNVSLCIQCTVKHLTFFFFVTVAFFSCSRFFFRFCFFFFFLHVFFSLFFYPKLTSSSSSFFFSKLSLLIFLNIELVENLTI